MNLAESRERFADDILERRFIRRVMRDSSKDIDQAQRKYISSRGFDNENWNSSRGFIISDDGMEYSHLKKHRFVDMRTRNTKKGKQRKKSHPIHNRIIWGHYNNIIKELHFGFTQAIKEELMKIQD